MKPAAGTEKLSSLQDKRPGPIAQFLTTLLVRRIIPGTFAILRRFAPAFRFPFTNTVIVTSFDLVQEVFSRQKDFPVPYQRQVDYLDWKPTFLLAMKDTPAYWETLENVKELWRTEDLKFVGQIANEVSQQALDKAGGKIDAIQGLMVPVTEAVIDRYYGVPIPSEKRQDFFNGCMHVAGFLFGAQSTAPKVVAGAQAAVKVVWEVIDDAIAAARKNPLPDTTIIGRCHAQNIVDDQALRSYLMGMIMGYLPTNTLANGHALDVIMNNRTGYQTACDAAAADDSGMILKCVHEALRISYILPGLWRTAPEDQEIGIGSKKTYKIKKDQLVYISGMSAMKDKRRIADPNRFDPNRSKDVYMVYGYHFHYCVGDKIADTMMEEIFTAIFKRKPKAGGKMVYNGNFPWNFFLSYEK
ncbi:cytochrome P450 [Kordiimonas lacus]|uniref:Cytochrome P450 n=1 Tax=Kordiimonas lacus TaxID=637679 RepID=A0A1G6U0I7_9PROT|nr:cytochrome P450 [Kordiimonas lacus]SDD34206.1 Cytochrome P450 [Kordiimonas lacus]